MYPILYLSLPGFYVTTARASGENPEELVIHGGGLVVDSDAKGIEPGVSLKEAKAMGRASCRFLPYRPDDFVEAQERWLTLSLDATHAIEPEEQHSTYLDLNGHPQPVDVATSLIAGLCRMGYRVRAGMAGSKWLARLAAQDCDERAVALGVPPFEPVTDAASFLAPLPTRLLTPVDPSTRERLEFLGYRRIGQVADAPPAALASQFGAQGVLIRQSARGLLGERVIPRFPPDSVGVSQRFPGGMESMTQIDEAIRGIARLLSGELLQRDLCGCQLIVTVEEECSAFTTIGVLGKPTQSELAISLAIARHLKGKMKRAVWGLRVTMPRLRRVGVTQAVLPSMRGGLERRVAADVALRMVRQSMGDESVRIAADLPVPRREQVLRIWKHATGWN